MEEISAKFPQNFMCSLPVGQESVPFGADEHAKVIRISADLFPRTELVK